MSAKYLDAIGKHWWPKETGRDIWAILDGAQSPRISAMLLSSYLDSSCLYSGPISRELEMAAPYLVQLEHGDELMRRIVEEGWGRNWGIFLKCSSNLARLRKHLRTFLVVRSSAGQRLVFRYYDPRVLRVYLRTCNAEELAAVFGPIETIWLEGEHPSEMIEFGFKARKLTRNVIRLA